MLQKCKFYIIYCCIFGAYYFFNIKGLKDKLIILYYNGKYKNFNNEIGT